MPLAPDGLIRVTKLHAARRQIDTALELWFHEGEPISTHTLIAAAHRIVGDVAEQTGKEGAILIDRKRLEAGGWNAQAFKKAIREPETFFKHAQNDPHETYTFDLGATELIFYSAIECYRRLVPDRTPLMSLFMLWFALRFPDTLTEKGRNDLRSIDAETSRFSRPEFFDKLHHIGAELGGMIG